MTKNDITEKVGVNINDIKRTICRNNGRNFPSMRKEADIQTSEIYRMSVSARTIYQRWTQASHEVQRLCTPPSQVQGPGGTPLQEHTLAILLGPRGSEFHLIKCKTSALHSKCASLLATWRIHALLSPVFKCNPSGKCLTSLTGHKYLTHPRPKPQSHPSGSGQLNQWVLEN